MKRLLFAGLFLLGLFWAIASFQGLANQGEYDSIVLDFRDDIPQEQIEAKIGAIAASYQHDPRLNSDFSSSDNVYVIDGDKELLAHLRRDLRPYTEFVEPNYQYHTTFVPNDPDYSQQWNLRSINIESAWDDSKGDGVIVAVIDTGVSRVPDLSDTEFVDGYDFVNNRTDASDDNGHGTHVAGTIAQSTNNDFGVAGVAYEAKLMPLKVLSASGGGEISDIAEAIRFAADHDADVINMSLGGAGASQLLEDAVNYAYNKGVVIVAAAGNSNQNAAGFPARYPHVISVSALDSTGQKAPYSNYGAGVDIAAPGGAIVGENGEGGILQNTIDPETGASVFSHFQGTSMAAPHVAGVAALIKATGVDQPDDVAAILAESSRAVGDDELNYFGSGHLDASSAVQLARRGQLNFKDFFRWLNNNGYLNLRFWFDGGVVALMPKILMVLGSYLLAWLLRNYIPFLFSGPLSLGLVLGSSGFFIFRGLYLFDLPQWPLRVVGSSVAELGTAIQASSALNPIFASALIPFGLMALLLGNPSGRLFSIGISLGMASCLAVSAVLLPEMVWIESGAIARIFLMTNAALCLGIGYLSAKTGAESA